MGDQKMKFKHMYSVVTCKREMHTRYHRASKSQLTDCTRPTVLPSFFPLRLRLLSRGWFGTHNVLLLWGGVLGRGSNKALLVVLLLVNDKLFPHSVTLFDFVRRRPKLSDDRMCKTTIVEKTHTVQLSPCVWFCLPVGCTMVTRLLV